MKVLKWGLCTHPHYLQGCKVPRIKWNPMILESQESFSKCKRTCGLWLFDVKPPEEARAQASKFSARGHDLVGTLSKAVVSRLWAQSCTILSKERIMVNGSFLIVIYLTLVPSHKIITADYDHMLKQVYSYVYLLLIHMSHLKRKSNHQKQYCGRGTWVAPLLKPLQSANSFWKLKSHCYRLCVLYRKTWKFCKTVM